MVRQPIQPLYVSKLSPVCVERSLEFTLCYLFVIALKGCQSFAALPSSPWVPSHPGGSSFLPQPKDIQISLIDDL